jgi:hypothetical protein
VVGASRSAVVLLWEASELPVGGFAEVAGAGFLHAHEWAAGSSAVGRKLSPVDDGHDGGAIGCRSPCWGHHGEALRSRCGGLSG